MSLPTRSTDSPSSPVLGSVLTTLLKRDDVSSIDPLTSDQQWLESLEQLCSHPAVVSLVSTEVPPDINTLTRRLQELATLAVQSLDSKLPAVLHTAALQAKSGRRVFSAASQLWRQATFTAPAECAWLACLMLYPDLADKAAPEQHPFQSRAGTFAHLEADLSACVARILQQNPQANTDTTRCARLLGYLHMDFALACSTDPQRLMPCLFGCATFSALETALIDDLQWAAPPHPLNRELALQAIVDYLDPVADRVEHELAGVVLDTSETVEKLRTRLDKALLRMLGCSKTELALMAPLLLRVRAPLLLLNGLPDDLEHLPNLYTVQLRLGIRLSGLEPWFLDLETAQQVPALRQALAHSNQQKAEILLARVPLIIQWAEYHQVLPPGEAHNTVAIMTAMKVYDSMAALAQLTEPPSRLTLGIRYLQSFGISPHEIVSGNWKTTYLERLLDSGSRFSHPALNGSTPADISTQFTKQFAGYRANCRTLLRDLINLFIQQLPHGYRQALQTAPLQAYAVQWYEYIGPNPTSIPPLDDADPGKWAVRRCPVLLIHCQGPEGETLHRWFPQEWRRDSRTIDRKGAPLEQWAREHLPLQFADYHDADQPFTYSTAGRLQAVGAPLPPGELTRLTDIALDNVWLHHFDDLEQQCRGMTQLEFQTKAIQERSTAAYLGRLGIPFASCFDTQGAGGVSHCVIDAVTLPLSALAPVVRTLVANRRLINRLLHNGGRAPLINTALALTRWLNLPQRSSTFNFARYYERALRNLGQNAFSRSGVLPGASGQVPLWVNGRRTVAVHNRGTVRHVDWRLQDPESGHTYGPRLLDLSPRGNRHLLTDVAPIARPGLNPGALTLHKGPEAIPYLQAHVDSQVQLVHRPDRSVDLFIDGHLYRLDRTVSARHYIRADRLAAVSKPRRLVETPTPCRLPRAPGEASPCTSLYSHRLPVSAPPVNATLGQQAAHAWRARTYHLAALAIAGTSNNSTDLPGNLDIVVMDGTLWRRANAAPKPSRLVRVTDRERTAYGLALPDESGAPVIYLPRITGRFAPDRRFGLHASATDVHATHINDTMPAIELDSLVAGVHDRRVLRGHVMEHALGPCIEIEADTHVFYRALIQPGELLFERFSDAQQINRFLLVSETYQVVSATPSALRDRENIARLLFDMIKLRPAPGDPALDQYPDYAAFALAMGSNNELLDFAVNVLAGNTQQLRLFELAKALIPDRALLTTRAIDVQQTHIDILNRLTPPQGVVAADITPITLDNLGDPGVHAKLRTIMASANIAFIQVTLGDGRRVVYYALSGGWRSANIRLAIDQEGTPRQTLDGVEWVDARAIMRDRGPDPEMTSLPVVRHNERKVATPHPRELDAERLIATVLKADLRGQPVTELQVFTRMDTCRSCGAIVLPQLQLLFPQAAMNISFLENYAID